MNKNNTPIQYEEKQTSWFKTDNNIVFENSFKFWFALQWQNKNIQIFVAFLIVFILEIVNFNTVYGWLIDSYNDGILTGIFVTPFMFLPLAGALIIVYKGFWQYFNDLSKGKLR